MQVVTFNCFTDVILTLRPLNYIHNIVLLGVKFLQPLFKTMGKPGTLYVLATSRPAVSLKLIGLAK